MLYCLFDHHHVFCMVRINSSGCQKAPRLNRRWSFVHILSWFENTRGVWLMISFFLQGDFIMSHSAQNKLKPQQTVVKCGSGSIPSWSVNDSRLLKKSSGMVKLMKTPLLTVYLLLLRWLSSAPAGASGTADLWLWTTSAWPSETVSWQQVNTFLLPTLFILL